MEKSNVMPGDYMIFKSDGEIVSIERVDMIDSLLIYTTCVFSVVTDSTLYKQGQGYTYNIADTTVQDALVRELLNKEYGSFPTYWTVDDTNKIPTPINAE